MAGRKHMSHSDEWWELVAKPHQLRCVGHFKSGDRAGLRCGREALPGSTVCRLHGGLIPAVQAAAAARIGMSVDDAVKQLKAMLDNPDVDAREKVKILHDLLDRGGLGATAKHAVAVGQLGQLGTKQMDPIEALFAGLAATPGILADPTAPTLPVGPSEYDLAVINGDPEYGVVVRGEVERVEPRRREPHHTEHLTVERPTTPEHIRRALDALL